jgi:hypothetical protein
VPIAIDPASRGRGQKDGAQLYQDYFDLGLDLVKADNSVEAGIYRVWQMLSSGRLKIFKTCRALLEEYRLYHRDEKGQIVKENDHLCDAWRYCMMTGVDYGQPKPSEDADWDEFKAQRQGNSVTGY